MILNEKFFIEGKNFDNKRVIVRFDYNVPTDKEGNITDNTRILASIPTLNYLLNSNAKVIIISHKGRPKGEKNLKYSLKSVEKELEKILIEHKIKFNSVKFVEDCIGDMVEKEVELMKPQDILILENLRFYAGEEKNDEEFAKKLAMLADCYVSDAFGAVHRAHASIVGIPRFLPYYYGYLIKNEIDNLNFVLLKKQSPMVAVIGGAKISSKIDVLKSFIGKADFILIGGAMAYTFLKAKGLVIGNSLFEKEKIKNAYDILVEADKKGVKVLLPFDHIVVDEVKEKVKKSKTAGPEIPDGKIGVDIGPKTIKEYKKILSKGKIIFWNGPMGIFEINEFATGTFEIAKIISSVKAFKVVGGGDSVAAIKKSGLEKGFSHISTGGGASLEYVEGKKLPGLEIFE